jgi:hypothetical protein
VAANAVEFTRAGMPFQRLAERKTPAGGRWTGAARRDETIRLVINHRLDGFLCFVVSKHFLGCCMNRFIGYDLVCSMNHGHGWVGGEIKVTLANSGMDNPHIGSTLITCLVRSDTHLG